MHTTRKFYCAQGQNKVRFLNQWFKWKFRFETQLGGK
jgi:hypothetical protein